MAQAVGREVREMPTVRGIHYIEHVSSSDVTVVLIHGAGGSCRQWPYQIRRMLNRRVLAIDLPGHGLSGGAGYSSVEAYGNSVFTWLQDLGLEQVVLAGHSMGAAIVLSMAADARIRERIAGLVLIGAGCRMPVNPALLENFARLGRVQLGIEQMAGWSFAKEAEEKLRQTMRKELRRNRAGAIYRDLMACAKFNFSGKGHKVRSPTLVIRGNSDMMVGKELAEELEQEVPMGELRTIPGAGHMVFQEQPREVAGAIKRFLDCL